MFDQARTNRIARAIDELDLKWQHTGGPSPSMTDFLRVALAAAGEPPERLTDQLDQAFYAVSCEGLDADQLAEWLVMRLLVTGA